MCKLLIAKFNPGLLSPDLCTWHALNFPAFNAFTPKSNSSTSITMFLYTLNVLSLLWLSRHVLWPILFVIIHWGALAHSFKCVLTIRKDINLQIWHQNVKFISSSYYIMAKFLSLSAINRSDVVATFACWKSPHVGMLSLSVKLFLLPQHFSVSSWLITWRSGHSFYHHACTSYFTRAKPVSQFVRD